jgi:hypothetical protein
MRTLGNRTSIPKKTSNVSSVNKPKVNVTNTSNSVPVAYADTGKPQIAKPRTIIDDIVNFGQDVYQGASDTVQSYNFFNDRPLNEYRKSSAQDVVIESAMTGKLGEGLGELGRRAQEQPGRLVGELLVEAGIIAGTFGGAAAVKVGATGAKVGSIAAKVATNKGVQKAAGVAANVSEKTPSQVKTVLSAADTVSNLGINKVFDKVSKRSSVFVGSNKIGSMADQNLVDVIYANNDSVDRYFSLASPEMQKAWGQVTPKGVIGEEVGKYSPSIEKTSGPIGSTKPENIFIRYSSELADGGRMAEEADVRKLVKEKLKTMDFDPNEERVKKVRTRYESELTSIRDKELGDVGNNVSDITNNFYNIETFDNRANTGIPLTKDYIQTQLNIIGTRGRTTNKTVLEISKEMDSFIQIATGVKTERAGNFLGLPNAFGDILPIGGTRKMVVGEPLGSAPPPSDILGQIGSSNIYVKGEGLVGTELRVKSGAVDVPGLYQLNEAEVLVNRLGFLQANNVTEFEEKFGTAWRRYFPNIPIKPNARVDQLKMKLANAASREQYTILSKIAKKSTTTAQRKAGSYGQGFTGEAALDADLLNKNPIADSPLTLSYGTAFSTTRPYTGIRTFSTNPDVYKKTPQWNVFKKDYEEWAKKNPAAKELRRQGVNVPKTAEEYMLSTGATLMDAMRSSSFTNLGGVRYATPKKGEPFPVFAKSDRFKESLKRAQSFLKGETGDSFYIPYTNPDKYSAIVDSSDSSMVLKSIIQNEQGLPLIEKTVNPLTVSSRVRQNNRQGILSDLFQVDKATGSNLAKEYISRYPSPRSGSSFNMFKAPILGWSPDTVKSSVRKVKTKANTSTTTPSTIYSQVFTKKQQKALKASSRKTRSAKKVKPTTNDTFAAYESTVGLPQGYNFSDMMNLQKSAKKKKTGNDDIMSQLRSGVTFRRGGFF